MTLSNACRPGQFKDNENMSIDSHTKTTVEGVAIASRSSDNVILLIWLAYYTKPLMNLFDIFLVYENDMITCASRGEESQMMINEFISRSDRQEAIH